ncbi:hypothetical protein EST38_g6528 [Candolleomyces aberdarensis]|uniref:Uncharacterized protein n=1 Tax=Candolleomyces aberdarensis TaxID=2316362 RepID=A0A4Q2DKE8_9AGAR|nr:hypothetical protein EST38_g6528 [Candolleomyces aberdarensis]
MAELEVPLSSKKKIALEKMCEQELGPNQDPQVMSAIWLDATGKPILFYFGQRVVDQGSGETLDLSEQYKGRTQKDLDSYMENNPKADIAHDGLNEKLCRIYQLAAQALCSDMAPNLRMDRTRHEGVNVMQYDAPAQSQTHDLAANDGEDIGVDDGMKNHPAYESDLSNSGVQEYERAGVVHLVHGWIQQGQPEKGLFISGDVSRSSSSLAATGSYYALTQDVADLLAAMFKVAFPDWYSRYREAFDAGVWIPNDTGPFLGRAIIYKLQGRLHRDRHDLGPSACFGVGSYIGGAMKIPQLNAKLAYQSGDVCIFFSSILYHKVDTYFPTTQSQEEKEQKITPGRIGSVFFFPKESYEVLKDKDSVFQLVRKR